MKRRSVQLGRRVRASSLEEATPPKGAGQAGQDAVENTQAALTRVDEAAAADVEQHRARLHHRDLGGLRIMVVADGIGGCCVSIPAGGGGQESACVCQ